MSTASEWAVTLVLFVHDAAGWLVIALGLWLSGKTIWGTFRAASRRVDEVHAPARERVEPEPMTLRAKAPEGQP